MFHASCRIPVVVAEQSPKLFAALHLTLTARSEVRLDDPVLQPLVVALPVVVLAELDDRPPPIHFPTSRADTPSRRMSLRPPLPHPLCFAAALGRRYRYTRRAQEAVWHGLEGGMLPSPIMHPYLCGSAIGRRTA
ncbi:MAG: hypothetical protein ACI9UA_004276 [Pseudoalteromonas tetraodonis]|jgi:hypothetical protein